MTMSEIAPKPERKPVGRTTWLVRLALLLGFVLLVVLGIRGWEWSNSTAFCTNVCHDVHPEEAIAYQDSYHARVRCAECHIGRESSLAGIARKSAHMAQFLAVLSGQYARPVGANGLRPESESCELCHWPSVTHSDRLVEIKRYGSDEANTEKRIYMVVRTGGGERGDRDGYGIHWHAESQVEFIAADERNQIIPWVRATLPDGRVVEYNDAVNPLTGEEIARADKQVIDCVFCHNRAGHPFLSPAETIDRALAEGGLDPDLPFVKKELLDLLTAVYDDQEMALEAVASLEARYRSAYPEAVAAQAASIKRATEVAQELVSLLVFEEPGVTWQSFPNNAGHTEFPGCFRCHDGKHVSADGASIRLQCGLCHSIPLAVGPDQPAPDVPAAAGEGPFSHQEANFVADHRFQANDDCAVCHGEIAFGSDDSSFCANSVCHGRSWSWVNLDASFPHPVPLEGKHAEVRCYDCHTGVEQLSAECVDCHEPPSDVHFGFDCETCHTTDGFAAGAQVPEDYGLPMKLEGAHLELACSDCHSITEDRVVRCAKCHTPPSGPPFGPDHLGIDCENCHELSGFEGATLPPGRHPVALIGAHQRVDCSGCHSETEPVPEFYCRNCHQPPPSHEEERACETCHTPEGWVNSAASLVPQMPHPAEGRESCLQCHGFGELLPVPDSHVGRTVDTCLRCHHILDAAPAPVVPHEMREDCLACHGEGGLRSMPADHQRRSNDDCVLCHEVTDTPPAMVAAPNIPHTLEGRDDCLLCHAAGGVKPAPEDHAGRASEDCQLCHQASAEEPPAEDEPPDIPHTLEGRDDCLMCHAAGGLKPVPEDHAGRASEDCQLCHQAGS